MLLWLSNISFSQEAMKGKTEGASKPLTQAEINAILAKVKALPAEAVKKDEVAVIETKFGRIVFKFFPEVAPNHCANFKKLATAGYYDGTTFHRVIPGFMIQGGDILTRDANRANDGTGGPGYTINAEFSNTPHVRGTVSMARATDPNSAGSQFFICVADAPHLNGQYSVFGQVIEGMKVVDQIVKAPRDARDNPQEPIVMTRVYVTTKDKLKAK